MADLKDWMSLAEPNKEWEQVYYDANYRRAQQEHSTDTYVVGSKHRYIVYSLQDPASFDST